MGTNIYDQYFMQQRQMNKYLYKMLFTDELLPFKNKENLKLGYKLDIPQSYEYYKNKPKPDQLTTKNTEENSMILKEEKKDQAEEDKLEEVEQAQTKIDLK